MNAEIPAADILLNWYKPETIYVDAIRPTIIEDGKVVEGIGRYIAKPVLHGAFNEPPYYDIVEHLDDATTVTTLTVTAAHMQGHPWAFPGHKISRAMYYSIYANLSRNSQSSMLQLAGYESVAYRRRINCGDTIRIMSKIDTQDNKRAEAEVLLNGEVAAIMRGAHLTAGMPEIDRDTILFDQLKEGAAQTVGLLAIQGEILEGMLPLFGGTGVASFDRLPRAGETVLYYVTKLRRRLSMFSADARIAIEDKNEEREIGNISRLTGVIKNREEL